MRVNKIPRARGCGRVYGYGTNGLRKITTPKFDGEVIKEACGLNPTLKRYSIGCGKLLQILYNEPHHHTHSNNQNNPDDEAVSLGPRRLWFFAGHDNGRTEMDHR
jgi:hypothetical protein